MSYGPYAADPDKANRLHAARQAAGFKTAKAAALAHGWSLATLQAHETANGYLDDAWTRVYATAFGVPLAWLDRNAGKGPPVDEVRAARFRARIQREGGQRRKDASDAGRRLRVARRLAGFHAVKTAAAAIGVNSSTLSAHEVGQNSISPEAAQLYATAFAIRADWLLTGKLPSGLSPAAEAKLDELLTLHARLEKHVIYIFDQFRTPTPPSRAPEPLSYPRKRGKAGVSQDLVPEVSIKELLRACRENDTPKGIPGRFFGFPADYLTKGLGCNVETAVVVTMNPDQDSWGERVLIDRAFKINFSDYYLLVTPNGRTVVLRGDDSQTRQQEQSKSPEMVVAGRVVSIFGRFTPRM